MSDDKKKAPFATGFFLFGLFQSNPPKIAGERYRPGGWIPYSQAEAEEFNLKYEKLKNLDFV